MRFTIDRSKWRCGGSAGKNYHGRGSTFLLNNHGYRCCLGFVGNQLGASDEQILGQGSPRLCGCFTSILVEWDDIDRAYVNSDLSSQAIRINDDDELDATTRERELTSLFGNHGHELAFTGEYRR